MLLAPAITTLVSSAFRATEFWGSWAILTRLISKGSKVPASLKPGIPLIVKKKI